MFWEGKRVFVTGHTGFKGSWLSLWLGQLGAEVKGYALEPPTEPSLFAAADVASGMISVIGDINNFQRMKKEICAHKPEIVFHLAAQPLVRLSYEDPIGTYQTNVMGTANLLEAVRACPSVRAVVVITTDKCYENREWIWAYRENDALGGNDPYSNSKACAELVVSAYRNSYFSAHPYDKHRVALATARAGNVIGGGDWARDRLIADMIRAFASSEVLRVRNPRATRPWQHVLEPLRGYLMLAERLYNDGMKFAAAWNFGPEYSDAKPVEWIVDAFSRCWDSPTNWEIEGGNHPHESQILKLDWSKAEHELYWRPALNVLEAIEMTASWYKSFLAGESARTISLAQIAAYRAKARFDDRAKAKT
jgi:CDP-glucose 4,6-dehydratase